MIALCLISNARTIQKNKEVIHHAGLGALMQYQKSISDLFSYSVHSAIGLTQCVPSDIVRLIRINSISKYFAPGKKVLYSFVKNVKEYIGVFKSFYVNALYVFCWFKYQLRLFDPGWIPWLEPRWNMRMKYTRGTSFHN